MSFSINNVACGVIFTTVCLFEQSFGAVSRGSASLTPSLTSSSIASVSLIEDDANLITSDGKFKCTQDNYDSFCVRLDIYNSGCNGIETIDITVYGYGSENGSPDLYSLFSVENSDNKIDYLSFFNDWSGNVRVVPQSEQIGGVFIAPNCESNNLLSTNNNNDIIDNLWDGNTNAWGSRKYVSDGNTNNFELLSSESIGYTSPLHFTIVNDLYTNILITYFSTDNTEEVSCIYNTVFDTLSGNDYVIGFQTDQATISFSQFDVDITCETTGTTGGNEDVCNTFNDYNNRITEFSEWYLERDGVYNHLLTTVKNPSSVINLGYKYIGDEGYIWRNEISGYTYPLYRYYSTYYQDHYYSMIYDENIEYYSYRGISGYLMTTECNQFNQPLYEYWSQSKGDHLYNIDFNELGMGNDDYNYIGIVGYVAKLE